MTDKDLLTYILSQLLCSIPAEGFSCLPLNEGFEHLALIRNILEGKNDDVILKFLFDVVPEPVRKEIFDTYEHEISLETALREFVSSLRARVEEKYANAEIASLVLQSLAISFLQLFIQLNFTGPPVSFKGKDLFYINTSDDILQRDATELLNIDGQQAYELVTEPLYLLISLMIFESFFNLDENSSLINKKRDISLDSIMSVTQNNLQMVPNDPIIASICWWRSRALWIQNSIFAESSVTLISVATTLLNPMTLDALLVDSENCKDIDDTLRQLFYLESARAQISTNTENLAIPFLKKAQEISGLELVVTGAKTKRTKFQTFYTTSLIVLAKSSGTDEYQGDQQTPEALELNSDVLLEKPEYETLEDIEDQETNESKRLKVATEPTQNFSDKSFDLLPVVSKTEHLPLSLKLLDPNSQPPLRNLDSISLLLRLEIIRKTSPSGNSLVEEELMALVGRILYASTNKQNWSLFSRALWERSVLETGRARTLERAILQMTSLIEEIGIKVKSRIIPQAAEISQENNDSDVASRIRYIHQLPLIPQWALDVKLAEKYLSIGVLKSAVEIYERLQMPCETALCYAAVDNEPEAEKILSNRIKSHPYDARAISILGDIRQDPTLWEKAWEISRYANAKASLARYFYAPPKTSGLTKQIGLALDHMRDCLTANPLSYENWYFYGCCGLESGNCELASEAFSRCIALDDTNAHAWSNLAAALLKLDKTKAAFSALKKAIRGSAESDASWRVYDNYLTVAAKLSEWNEVLFAAKHLLNTKVAKNGENSIDIRVIEKLAQILVSSDYPMSEDDRLTYFQSSCIDFICNQLPKVITRSTDCWNIVAKVHIWRKRPWDALDCYERAFRTLLQNPNLDHDEKIWTEAIEVCTNLVNAYESLGELPGKHGAGDVVCSDWKYKAKSSIRSLMSKGKVAWEDSEGWESLKSLKEDLL